MRIVFLNHNVAWRGGFFRAYHWGRYLAKAGHEVTLLTISEASRWAWRSENRAGLTLVTTPDWCSGRLRSGWDPFDTIGRVGYVLRGPFDLVHSVDSRPACVLPALLMSRVRKTKFVLDWGDWWGRGGTITNRSEDLTERLFAPVETFFEERFRGYADGNVVLTSALERRALELGVPRERLVRIPHGADVEQVRPQDKWKSRDMLGIPQNAKVIGFVGTNFPAERTMMLEAFDLMQRTEKGLYLALIGRTNIIPAEVRKWSDRVLLTGPLAFGELQGYIAACDVMLLPLKDTIANRGRWPSKICDYLAAGRPVVASAVGDLQQLFSSSTIGALADATTQSFAETVLTIIHSPDLEMMGQNARALAESRLDWRILTRQLVDFYDTISQLN